MVYWGLLGTLTLLAQYPAPHQMPAHPLGVIEARDGFYHVMVEFSGELDEQQLRNLQRVGVRFERMGQKILHVGRFYGVRVPRDQWESFRAQPHVIRVGPAHRPMTLPTPTESLYGEVPKFDRANVSWPRRLEGGQRSTGAGVLIANLDSGIDPFHPMFFRPDGGFYEWIDVNGNQRFDEDIDAVDLNENREADDDEVVRAFGGGVRTWEGISGDGGDEIGLAWFFADTDRDHRRDYGPSGGFTDDTPGFGEPMFVVDDVNRDGQLNPGEKLVRLGTSKIKAIVRQYEGRIYRRGQDLVDAKVSDYVDHGTAASGIMVGGAYGYTQVQGLAPDAELIMLDRYPADGDPEDPEWSGAGVRAAASELGADILIHEYGSHVGNFGDGSDFYESLLDELTEDGMVQVTANHNFAGEGGNAIVTVPPQGSVTLPVRSDGVTYGIYTTVRWKGGRYDLEATYQSPGGTLLDLDEQSDISNLLAYGYRDRSSRGTGMITASIYAYSGSSWAQIPSGDWSLVLSNESSEPREVYATVSDYSAYAYYVYHTGPYTTDDATMASPSTADTAISVGACAVNGAESRVGELESFSGRGPRIDGVLGIDIVAPSDHFTATFEPGSQGHYRMFGGTSGALPNVGAAVALLLQREGNLTPAQVRTRLQNSARTDQYNSDAPNKHWGHGYLDVWKLLNGDEIAPQNPALPVAAAAIPPRAERRSTVTLDASQSDGAGFDLQQLHYRWDLNYDGAWDIEVAGAPQVTVDAQRVGRWVKLEVETPEGWSSQVLAAGPSLFRGKSNEDGGGCVTARPAWFGLWSACVGWLLMRRRRRLRP